MPQDAFSLRYLAKELNSLFANGKINRITQSDNDNVIFTIYNGKFTKKLLISVNPSNPRIGVIESEPPTPLTAPNFCMLLRKHLINATIKNISVVGYDRIIRIELEPSQQYFDSTDKIIYVELMGRYSNVVLTENNKILGGNRGINVFDNGVRPLFVGKEYLFPPVGGKKMPNDPSLIDYYSNFNGDDLAKYIFNGVQGVSLLTCSELVERYNNNNGDKANFGKSFFDYSVEFLYNMPSNPCVAYLQGELKDVLPFPYQSLDCEYNFFDTLYMAENFYFSTKEISKVFAQTKSRLTAIVLNNVKKISKKLKLLSARESDALDCENNKIFGELILSNIYNIKQGDEKVEVFNYYTNEKIIITLDKNLSPSKNAEKFYKKYNKQKRTLMAIKPQKELLESEFNYLNSILDEIYICNTVEDLMRVKEELEHEGYVKANKNYSKQQKNNNDCREYEIDGFIVKVGRNNIENDRLTFSAKSSDIWLHAKAYNSAHVIIVNNKQNIPNELIEKCAKICAYYSKGREEDKVEVVYTQKKFVKKPPKSKLGFCSYENYNSLVVKPDNLSNLLKKQ